MEESVRAAGVKREDEFIPRGAFLDEVKGFRSESGSGSHVLQSTGETISLGHFHWSVQEWQIEGMSAGDVCIFNVCPGNFPFFWGGGIFFFLIFDEGKLL